MKRFLPLALTLSVTPVYAAQDTPALTVIAAPAPAPVVEPAARELLDKSASAYKALTSLSLAVETSVVNGDKTTNYSSTLLFSRPDKAKATVTSPRGTTHVVASGEKFTQELNVEPLAYRTADLKGPRGFSAVLNQLTMMTNFGLAQIVGGQSLEQVGYKWETISLQPDNAVHFTGRTGNATHDVTVTFDAADSLIRKIVATRTFQEKPVTTTVNFKDVKLNPTFTDADFVYTPAPGVKEYVAPPAYDPKLVAGATPYDLKGLPVDGKPVKWEEYKGKVVLLDFWATWCGPCIGELPNVLKNYEAYHPQGFEIIGVSLDEDKKALTDFIAKRDLKYVNLFDGQGWKNVDAKGYGIQAIPFTLLIGKDGKIAAVNPRGEKLEPALKEALAK